MDYATLNPILAGYMCQGSRVYTDLDPIDKTTVGRASIRKMWLWASAAKVLLISTLLDLALSGQAPWLVAARDDKQVFVSPRYAHHMDYLDEVGLLEEVGRGKKRTRKDLRWYSSYFAVEKTSVTSRSIFNGHRLSLACPAPPNVNLLTPPDVLRLISMMMARGKDLHFIEADFRHWFHQIPVADKLSNLFGLQLKQPGKSFCWRCLPMGWSWSPAIAQAAGWTCLLFTEKDQSPIFQTQVLEQKESGLPRWVTSISGNSVALVYYDNLLVVSTDLNESKRIGARLRQNVGEKLLNVEIKGDFNASCNAVRYLGMDILIRRENGDLVLAVRPVKLDKWRQKTIEEDDSCRNHASIVGKILFYASLLNPNLQCSELGQQGIRLARHVGKEACLGGWERHIASPPGMKDLWERILQEASNYQLVASRRKVNRDQANVILATDASMAGWGVNVLDKNCVTVQSIQGKKWTDAPPGASVLRSPAEEHIFYKELRACLYGLTQLSDGSRAVVVVDNAAVAWVLRNGFSKSELGNRLLHEHHKYLDRIHDICLVVTKDNPADCASRADDKDFADRLAKLAAALEKHNLGYRWASHRDEHDWSARLHDEPADKIFGPDEEEE